MAYTRAVVEDDGLGRAESFKAFHCTCDDEFVRYYDATFMASNMNQSVGGRIRRVLRQHACDTLRAIYVRPRHSSLDLVKL